MKSRLLLLVVIGLMAAGCSRQAGGPQRLTWWQFWTSPDVRPVVAGMAADFEAKAAAKVQLGDLTWSDGHEKIAIGLAGGSGPDVVELGSDWVAEFAAGGRLLDLNPYLGGLRDSLMMWEPAEFKGGVYAVPWMLGTRVLFCNQTLLTQAGYARDFVPTNWGELLDAARKVDALGDDIFGFASNSAERHRLYKKFLPFFWSAGGEVFGADQVSTQFSSAAGQRSLEFYLQLSAAGLIETQARLEEYFVAGKVGFVISGEWLVRRLRQDRPAIEWGVTPMPADSVTGVGVSFVGGEYLVVNKQSAQPELAVALLRHLTLPPNDAKFAAATGSFTPVNRHSPLPLDSTQAPIAAVFQQQLRSSRATPVHPDWVAIEEILERGLEQALFKKLSAAEALAMIDRDCGAVLQRRYGR